MKDDADPDSVAAADDDDDDDDKKCLRVMDIDAYAYAIDYIIMVSTYFLPRTVRPSVCNVEVPCSYKLGYFKNNYTNN